MSFIGSPDLATQGFRWHLGPHGNHTFVGGHFHIPTCVKFVTRRWTFARHCITLQYKGRQLHGASINDAIAGGSCHQIRALSQKVEAQTLGSSPRGFGTISGHSAGRAAHPTRTRSSRQRCQRPARPRSAPSRVLDPPAAPWPLNSCWIPGPLWHSWTVTRGGTMTASPHWKNGPAL